MFPSPLPELCLLMGSEKSETLAVFFEEQPSVKAHLLENNFTVFYHAYFQGGVFSVGK
jgi:hypothetical protein